MGMLAVRSYDLKLWSRLVDVLCGDGDSVEFVVSSKNRLRYLKG